MEEFDMEDYFVIVGGEKIKLSDYVNTKPLDKVYDLARIVQQMIDENKRISIHDKVDRVLIKASKVIVVIGAAALIICPFFDGIAKSLLMGLGLATVGSYGISKLMTPNENNHAKRYYIQSCEELLEYIKDVIQRREDEIEIFPDVFAN